MRPNEPLLSGKCNPKPDLSPSPDQNASAKRFVRIESHRYQVKLDRLGSRVFGNPHITHGLPITPAIILGSAIQNSHLAGLLSLFLFCYFCYSCC